MSNDNDNSGPEEPATTETVPPPSRVEDPRSEATNVISFSDFQKNKQQDQEANKEPWPAAVPKDQQIPIHIQSGDPQERRILLSLAHGDIVVDGFLGLSTTFLAVGDAKGQIKFAAAPNYWLYAKDVTDDEEYGLEFDGPETTPVA